MSAVEPKIRALNKNLQKIAEAELNESPARIKDGLAELKGWIMRTPHLRARTDDQFLVSFLRGCKYDVDRAKTKIDSFYTIRSAVPEFFANREITQDFIDFIRGGFIIPLPDTDGPAGQRVFLCRTTYNPNQVAVTDLHKYVAMLQDIMMLEDDNLMLSGSYYVFDYKNVRMDHFKSLTSTIIRKTLTAWQNGNPFRLKGIFYINTPSVVMHVLNFIKSLMKDKMRLRVSWHESSDMVSVDFFPQINVFAEDYEILYDIIPKRLLPFEYGGDAGKISEIMEYWVQKVLQYEEYFKEDAKYGTDEDKRPGIPQTTQTLFGLSGSFQNLDCF